MGLFDILASIGTMASPVPKKSTIQATPSKQSQAQRPSVSGNDNWLQDSLDYYGYDPRKIDPISQAEEKDRVAGLLSEDLEGFSGATKSGKKAKEDFNVWKTRDPFASEINGYLADLNEERAAKDKELGLEQYRGMEGYNQGWDTLSQALSENKYENPIAHALFGDTAYEKYGIGATLPAGEGINQGSDALKNAANSSLPISELEKQWVTREDILGREGKDRQSSEDSQSSAVPATTQSAAEVANGATEAAQSATEASTPSQSYTSRKPTTEMEEFYEILENHPELAEKYAEFMDRDNYGYSRARASRNSDLFADLALADPRIMNRMRASGIDVDDIENLSNNIYDYMWGDNVIDLYDYMNGGKGYLGDSDLSVQDMLGYLGQNYSYGFDPDFLNRYGLDADDAYVQALIRNAAAGGAKEYDLDRVSELMRKSGYLKDDENLTWGDTSSDYYVNNSGKRGNLTQYKDLAGTEYLAPDLGVIDTNAPLSLSEAIALSEAQLRDANGNPPNRRLIVSNGKGKSAKDYANVAALDAAANLGYY